MECNRVNVHRLVVVDGHHAELNHVTIAVELDGTAFLVVEELRLDEILSEFLGFGFCDGFCLIEFVACEFEFRSVAVEIAAGDRNDGQQQSGKCQRAQHEFVSCVFRSPWANE